MGKKLRTSFMDGPYLLQIVKCKDLSYLTTSRTKYGNLLGSRFIPPPVPLKCGNARPNVHAEGKFGGFFQNLWLSHKLLTRKCLTPTVPG